MTATKPARTMTADLCCEVLTTGDHVKVLAGDELFDVEVTGYQCVTVKHWHDRSRSYDVAVSAVGLAVDCGCKGFKFRRTCKHCNLVSDLVCAGKLEIPAVADAADAMADRPESWLAAVE